MNEMIDLIILDLYGTIAGPRRLTTPRNGFREFIDRYHDKKIVIATDERLRHVVNAYLTDLEIINRLDRVYVREDMIEIDGFEERRKDLKRICDDHDVAPDRAVFISDSDKDYEDAQRDGVKFVHVPYYLKTDETFSFAMIDLTKPLPSYLDLRAVTLPLRPNNE